MEFCGMRIATSIFEAMDMKLDIGLTDLMRLILQLPEEQRAKLQTWLSKDEKARRKALEELLLKAPTMSDAQAKRYEEVRKAIDEWR
jgi:hypothetical protein